MKRVVAILVLLAVAVATFASAGRTMTLPAATRPSEELREERGESSEAESPTALAKHLEKLSQTIPGMGGESGEGPGVLGMPNSRRGPIPPAISSQPGSRRPDRLLHPWQRRVSRPARAGPARG